MYGPPRAPLTDTEGDGGRLRSKKKKKKTFVFDYVLSCFDIICLFRVVGFRGGGRHTLIAMVFMGAGMML